MKASLSRTVLSGALIVILAAPAGKDAEMRQHFLAMAARAFYPGRTGQLMIIAREGPTQHLHESRAAVTDAHSAHS